MPKRLPILAPVGALAFWLLAGAGTSTARAQLGSDLARRYYGDRSFGVAGRGDGVVVYRSEDPSQRFLVVTALESGRVYAAQLPYRYENPMVQVVDTDFGPGLIRVRVRTVEPSTRRERSRRRRAPYGERHFGEERDVLLSVRGGRLQRVHEIVRRSNRVRSARDEWDPRARTLTVVTQNRNPPGRERCRAPDPITSVHRWTGSGFETMREDHPGPPCH